VEKPEALAMARAWIFELCLSPVPNYQLYRISHPAEFYLLRFDKPFATNNPFLKLQRKSKVFLGIFPFHWVR